MTEKGGPTGISDGMGGAIIAFEDFQSDPARSAIYAKHDVTRRGFLPDRRGTYRAQAFKSDLPYKEYGTWQPRKLVAVMADIDPRIMRSSTIRIGRQEEQGKVSTNMRTLGTEFVLSSEDINFVESIFHLPKVCVTANIDGKRLKISGLRFVS
jgi:hypothetical protein